MLEKVVSSFDVDHRTLSEGLYLRSTYTINEQIKVLSWDLRFCAPMARKPLSAGTVHTIEHLMAYYLRLDPVIGSAIISFCPMGCQTGFYLSTTNSVTREDIAAALIRTFEKVFPIHTTEDIVGLNEIQCGNPYLYAIEETNQAMESYIKILKEQL